MVAGRMGTKSKTGLTESGSITPVSDCGVSEMREMMEEACERPQSLNREPQEEHKRHLVLSDTMELAFILLQASSIFMYNIFTTHGTWNVYAA
jgi:hypothetical protein